MNENQQQCEEIISLICEGKFAKAVSKGVSKDYKTGVLTLSARIPVGRGSNDLINMSWKEFKSSKLPHDSHIPFTNEFVAGLALQLKQFSDTIEYMTYVKEKRPKFEDKVEWLMKRGAKYNERTGIKDAL